jgi:chaperone required for assembly of F1-ATPase
VILKRFYKQAGIAETQAGFGIMLDGKQVRTSAGKPLVIDRYRSLALEIAAEWDAQKDQIIPSTMPMTQLATTALDRVGPERNTILDHLAAYAETDLVCYRAQSPAGLRQRQDSQWQPLLDWVQTEHGVSLLVTEGILAIEQPPETIQRIRSCFDALELWHLTAAQVAAAAAGSAVLALGLATGRLDGEQVFALSQIDDVWQIERWGEDAEAEQRRKNLRADIMAAEKLLRLIA